MNVILLLNLICTAVMVGVIWIVQLVHYPIFDQIDRDLFPAFAARHQRQISFIVIPLMLTELATSFLLVRSSSTNPAITVAWVGLALVGVAWLSTFLLSVPQHEILSRGFDEKAYRLLVNTNWIRTIAWTARLILLGYVLLEYPALFNTDQATPVEQ